MKKVILGLSVFLAIHAYAAPYVEVGVSAGSVRTDLGVNDGDSKKIGSDHFASPRFSAGYDFGRVRVFGLADSIKTYDSTKVQSLAGGADVFFLQGETFRPYAGGEFGYTRMPDSGQIMSDGRNLHGLMLGVHAGTVMNISKNVMLDGGVELRGVAFEKFKIANDEYQYSYGMRMAYLDLGYHF